MNVVSFKKGEYIIKEGDFDTWACIINSGKVEVSTLIDSKKKVLATLGAKQIFGEMGLIDDHQRSATVIAIEDTEVQVISRDSFKSLFFKDPKVILPIVKALFDRLRESSHMVNSYCQTCGVELWPRMK